MHTNIGKVVLPRKEFYVPLGFIAAPEPEINILPVNDNVVRLTLKRNNYIYTPSDRVGKANKEVIFKIYNNDNGNLLDTIVLTNPNPNDNEDVNHGTWHTITKDYRRESGIHYNTKFRLESEYVAVNGVRSPISVKNFEIGNRPDVIIGKPELRLELVNGFNIQATILNTFSVSGLEDTTHKATSWTLKNGSSVIWASLMDEANLSSMTFGKNTPRDFIELNKTYTLEVQWVASNGVAGPITKETITTLSNIEYYLKQVYDGTASPNRIHIEGRVINNGSNSVYIQRRVLVDNEVILDWKTC